ncbi:MAG: DUF1549 domain-containing protein [Planctomycetaceae bacterium]
MTGMYACRVIALCVFGIAGFADCLFVCAEDALRSVIDQRLTVVSGFVPGKCSDAEFLRRISLDLIGMPPTADDARAFLNDASPDKREQLVDRLLASPHYARHLMATLDVMLMERRAHTHVSADEWQAWLLKSVRDNKPWNVLVREILTADGDDPVLRPAARFALDRGAEPNLLTHDISRIFFGRDMQCAQCHDHPLVTDYLQSDYQGLLAYVSPSYALVRTVGDKTITLHAERAGSDLPFESVFAKGTPHRTGPRMPEDVVLDEPLFLPGEEYEVAPADNVKSVPKFSRRTKLAQIATSGHNRAFNQNIANRLWAHMLGRGLVHPVDLHHPDNPATDPELLRILSDRLVAMNFNIRDFLREVALSQTYQRPFDVPVDLQAAASHVTAHITELQQQRPALAESAKQAADKYSAATDAWYAAEAAALPVAGELDAARNAYAEAKKKADEARAALAAVRAQLQLKQTVATLIQEAAVSAQAAAMTLSSETELVNTAMQLVTRAQQLSAEAAALAPMVEEKSAAVKPLAEAQDAARVPIDTAIAKYAPLKDAQVQAENTMLASRRQSAEHSQQLGALDERIRTAEQLAALPGDQQSINQSQRSEIEERLVRHFCTSGLKPLTPEQLCWSVFRVTGVYDNYWRVEVAELDRTSPLTDEQKQDPAVMAARNVELEQRTYDKLKGNVATFVTLYGAAAGQPQGDFFSTADQALFVANGGSINSWVGPSGDNVTDRVIRQTDSRIAAEEIYLSILTRPPTEDEVSEVTAYLADRTADRSVAVQELVWAVLNSAEFRFNH